MFLNQLSLEEKEAFLSLSVNAAKANGEFTAEEHLMIEEYCREMGIAFFDMSETKTVDEIAREVIQGKWGTGLNRKQRLTAAGYDYNAVQKRVNELM